MTGIEILLLTAFGGVLFTCFTGRISSSLRNIAAVILSIVLVVLVALLYDKNGETVFYRGFFGIPMVLRINTLSWFFAIAISTLGCLSVIFSLGYMRDRKNTSFYYSMLLLVNSAMLGVVFSGDMFSFFIFWEIMSWSTFLLISYNRGPAVGAGLKYIIMSIIGSMAMLAGIISLYTVYGTLNIADLSHLVLSSSTPGHQIFLLIIFGFAFGIKNAVVPLHTWLPDVYTEAPSPFSAVIAGMLTRMGVYGFLLIIYVILGAARSLHTGTIPGFNHILAWLGAITIVIPTFIAMLQNDAKRLLAWSGIGQGGYMILGIAFGTNLGVAGGIFHTLNHAIYIVLLFMSVAAVQYRTGGVRDLNSLGGLIKKMPVAFFGALIGICGLIGVPLTNGFVSKWMIFKTLITGGAPFLAFAALIGSWGTILAAYKLLHNMFLGQLPERFSNTRQSPFSMKLPMIVLSFTILLFGILPGLPLKVINNIVVSFGFGSLDVSLWGIVSETGMLNTINLFAVILAGLAVVWLFFRIGARAVPVNQSDNYAAGAAVPGDRYNYTVKFYDPLTRTISPYLRDIIDSLYQKIAVFTGCVCNGIRKIYTGYIGNYIMYIVLFVSLIIIVQMVWSPW